MTAVDRLNGINSGLAVKAPCIAATTANITLSGAQTIDGVAVVTGNRVLVKNQTSAVNNGIYVVSSTAAWSRATDFDGSRDVMTGTRVLVTGGTVSENVEYVVTTSGTITPGTSSITFEAIPDFANVTFLQEGTGAIERTALSKMQEWVSILDFGADPTGVADSADAFDSVFALAETKSVHLLIPPGIYKVTRKIYCSSAYSFTIEGCGTNVSVIRFTNTGSDGGFEYQGAYESSQDRPYFSVKGLSFYTYGVGQNCIKALFRVIGSSQFSNYDFRELDLNVSNVNDTGIYWSHGIWVIDGWNGVVEKVTANQSIPAMQGTMIALDGLSPNGQVINCNGNYWNEWLYLGYQTVTGLKGTIVGTHLYGEIVTGGTSGATGYVCYVGDMTTNQGAGTTYNIQVEAISGTFQNGEVVTGNTSGATITLTAGPGVVQIPGEGAKITQCEAVIVNYGVVCTIPATAIRPCVGIMCDSFHTNALVKAFNFTYCYQTIIGSGLHYARANNWAGIAMDYCDESNISAECRLDGLAYTGTLGVSISHTTGGRFDALVNRCVTGLSITATCVSSDFGMSFKNCTTKISNGGTIYPDANGNNFHRCALDEAGYGGSFAPAGWGTPSGTLLRTTFDTATITHADLAKVVGALVTDLKYNRKLGA